MCLCGQYPQVEVSFSQIIIVIINTTTSKAVTKRLLHFWCLGQSSHMYYITISMLWTIPVFIPLPAFLWLISEIKTSMAASADSRLLYKTHTATHWTVLTSIFSRRWRFAFVSNVNSVCALSSFIFHVSRTILSFTLYCISTHLEVVQTRLHHRALNLAKYRSTLQMTVSLISWEYCKNVKTVPSVYSMRCITFDVQLWPSTSCA